MIFGGREKRPDERDAELSRSQKELDGTRLAFQETQGALYKTQAHYEGLLKESQLALGETQAHYEGLLKEVQLVLAGTQAHYEKALKETQLTLGETQIYYEGVLKESQLALQKTQAHYEGVVKETQLALEGTQVHYERLLKEAQGALEETQHALRQTQVLLFEGQEKNRRLQIASLNSSELNPDAPQQQSPSIFINAVPKTAGLYIFRTLAAGLNYTPFETCLNIFPGAVLDHRRLGLFMGGNCICHHHLDASDINLWHIARNDVPMIFHTRDLRPVMLSWTHHLSATGTPAAMGGHALIAPGQEFFDRPLEWQIDWVIETQLPVYVQFMQGWLSAIGDGRVNALLTRYEDFIADRQAFFDKIVKFFRVSHMPFSDTNLAPSRDLNLRSGNPNEWRSAMAPSQVEKINAGIPADWWERFSWVP
jgi:hypothetical protein